jgi:hypothetical protein
VTGVIRDMRALGFRIECRAHILYKWMLTPSSIFDFEESRYIERPGAMYLDRIDRKTVHQRESPSHTRLPYELRKHQATDLTRRLEFAQSVLLTSYL